MAYGLKAFEHIQISNVEDSPGSAEAAEEILTGATANITYGDKVIHQLEQDRNSLSRNLADDFVVGTLVEGSIEMALNFRHALWLFSNSIRGNITRTQPDASNQPLAFLRTFEPGLTTANTPDITDGIDTFTLEFGDSIQNLETEFVFTRTLTITGAANEPVMVTWDITGRQLTETSITGALSVVAVEYAVSNQVEFYVDSSVANWGTTEKKGMLRGFTWTLETQFTPRFGADGSLYFYGLNEDKKAVELELIYNREATSELEKDKYNARTTTFLRIAILGQTEIDSGQANIPYIYLDGAYRYFDWTEPGDEDGSVTETVSAQSVYDATGSKDFSVKLYNDVDDYPSA